jgi:hypothetical protein
MKETTQAKITASIAIAKAMAQKALAPNPNPQWTEFEMRSIDEWIARQGVKLDRPEASFLARVRAGPKSHLPLGISLGQIKL